MLDKSLPATSRFRLLSWPTVVVVLLLIQAALSVIFRQSGAATAYTLITYFLVLVLAAAIATLNAVRNKEAIRLFWSFLALALVMWSLNALSWIYSVLVQGQNHPAYLVGGVPLVLHIVFIIAAVAARPHFKFSTQRGYRTTLNFLLLLFFWTFAYAFLWVPHSYTDWNVSFLLRGQALYLAENFLLLFVLGVLILRSQPPWKSIYGHLIGASALYMLGSLAANIILFSRGYYAGLKDIPYTAAACWFVWVAMRGRRLAPELTQSVQSESGDTKYGSLLAMLSVLAVPVVGVWEVARADEPYRTRVIRLLIVLISALLLGVFLFVREYLANRELFSDVGLANDRLHLAMQSGKAVGWEWDLKTGRDFWFGDLKTMFGIPSNRHVGRPEDFHRYVHPEDRKLVSDAVADARTNHRPYAAEFRVVWPDGTLRWVTATGKFYYSPSGEPERMLGMAVDITDRKQAEDAVKESEKRYRRIVETTNEGVWLLDSRLHTSYVNQQMAEMLGHDPGEMVGRSVFDSYFPEDVERKKQLLERRRQGVREQFEERLRHRDGSELWVRMAAIPVSKDNGEFDGALAMVSDITERKRAEEALRESEARLRLAAQAGKMYAYEWDVATDKVMRSEECVNILGFKAHAVEQLTRQQLLARVHPDDRALFVNSVDRATPENPTTQISYRMLRPDGSVIWLEKNARAFFDERGRMLRVIGMVADITERKQLEEELLGSQERLAGIVASAMDAIIAIDDAQKTVLFNAAAEKMFGCPVQEAVGSSIERFIPERFRAGHSAHIRHFGETGSTSRNMGTLGTLWALRANGDEFPIEASISHVDSPGKKLFTVIIRDVTDRRRAEEALRESEERFRLVANTAPVMIWMSDTDKLCTYFNTPWLEFTGRSLESELGNGWAQGVHPEDFKTCLETYIKAFDRRERFTMEYRLRRYDGEYRWVLDIGVPRFSQDSSFAGFIGSCVDVTDRKLAEEALSSMNRRLFEAQELERTRIARELHDDINQRLALVAVGLQQADDLQQNPPRPGVEVSSIRDLGRRVSEISADVQAISHRLHSSKLEYLGIVMAAQSFCKEFSEQQKVEVVFAHDDIPHTTPREISLCLFRVLQEALRNAVQHGGAQRIEVELSHDSDVMRLAVRDSGSGFELEEAMRAPGIGLISMAERVRLMGGRFSADSQPQCGTTILASIPLGKAAGAIA